MANRASLSFDNDVFTAFAWYGVLLVLKMMVFSAYIATARVLTKTFANEEDVRSFGSSITVKDKPATGTKPAIERARRAHLNDIENIVPFFLIGIIYALTNPKLRTATLLFKVFFGARLAHTVAYLFKFPQPARFICCSVGYVTTFLMGYAIMEELGLDLPDLPFD